MGFETNSTRPDLGRNERRRRCEKAEEGGERGGTGSTARQKKRTAPSATRAKSHEDADA